MDDIRTDHEPSLTEREPQPPPDAPEHPSRRKVGPESEVRGGPEAPEDPR